MHTFKKERDVKSIKERTEKEEKTELMPLKGKKIIKIRAEANKIEDKIEKISKISWFFEKINRIGKPCYYQEKRWISLPKSCTTGEAEQSLTRLPFHHGRDCQLPPPISLSDCVMMLLSLF